MNRVSYRGGSAGRIHRQDVVYSMWVTSCSRRGLFLNVNQRDWQTPSIHPPPPPRWPSSTQPSRETCLRICPRSSFGREAPRFHTSPNGVNIALLCACVRSHSAAVHRVPVLGLEGEPGLWRAQPHPAGEQEAGQGPGESVTQWVDPALLPLAPFHIPENQKTSLVSMCRDLSTHCTSRVKTGRCVSIVSIVGITA